LLAGDGDGRDAACPAAALTWSNNAAKPPPAAGSAAAAEEDEGAGGTVAEGETAKDTQGLHEY